VSLSIDAMTQLPHSGSTLLLYRSVEEQEREAGLTRNDYFSLWQRKLTPGSPTTPPETTPHRAG
jgi:hypothetical protein